MLVHAYPRSFVCTGAHFRHALLLALQGIINGGVFFTSAPSLASKILPHFSRDSQQLLLSARSEDLLWASRPHCSEFFLGLEMGI